ncbi:GGDEF domain-containing protein [Enterobacter huaxiensis]|uniref:GGDEF domain-containing protein n=1 Tax=Enterobacter huaxiensis TaxID=2494702 RepID=UPI000E75EAEC|nr:GGDEF domain-containing protein [Enterobacter huaxiensis]UNC52607.1 GGDEF domain-containing protein [Enterobacter huaxiensis]
MSLINNKSKISVLIIIVVTSFVLCLSFLTVISFKELNYIELVTSEIKNFYDLEFTQNEEIALSLSTTLTYKDYATTSNHAIAGKLIRINESKEGVNDLLAGIRIIEKNVKPIYLKNKYLISPSAGVLYFFDADTKPFQHAIFSHIVKEKELYTRKEPDHGFYSRLLNWNANDRLNSVTGIYADSLTGELEDTMYSPFFDLRSGRFMGYVYADISRSLNNKLARKFVDGKKWVSLYLRFDETGEGYCFYGSCENALLKNETQTSKHYVIIGGVDIVSLALNNHAFIIFCIMIILVDIIVFILHKKQNDYHHTRIFTDALTGVYNRRVLENLNSDDYAFIILFDCNEFKEINDSYGHDAGDRALKQIVQIIINNVREKDIVLRYGGDEFVVVIKHGSRQAVLMAERISSDIKRNPLILGYEQVQLSVSYGVSYVSTKISDAIAEADIKMFEQKKENKKSRVCSA